MRTWAHSEQAMSAATPRGSVSLLRRGLAAARSLATCWTYEAKAVGMGCFSSAHASGVHANSEFETANRDVVLKPGRFIQVRNA